MGGKLERCALGQLPRFRVCNDSRSPHGLRMRKGESIGKHVETPAKRIKIIPWTSSMGGENGKNRLGSRPLRSRDPSREKAAGRRPATRWGTPLFLLGRNGHDGSANASPDPLLLAPDPMSWHIAYQTGHNLGSYDSNLLGREGLPLPLHHHLLDLPNRRRRIQTLRTSLRTVHNGVATVKPERIL